MRWEDERYVRIFTRDTPTWDAMGWEAQALLMLVFRKMDRTGLLELGSSGLRGLAACVRMPVEVVEVALKVLLDDGVLAMNGKNLFCKNFMEAQECSKSDALRSREKRERAHLKLTLEVAPLTPNVAQATQGDTSAPRSDTPSVPSVPCLPVRKRSSAKPMESAGFSEFWKAYPRKVAKGAALKAWPGDDHLPAMLAALKWQEVGWTDPKFIPHPATYLHQRRWEDERFKRPVHYPPLQTPVIE